MPYNPQNRPNDKPGKPALPLRIVIDNRLFEKTFKYTMRALLTERTIDYTYIQELNKELRKVIVHGFERVDFESDANKKAMDALLEELWSKFAPTLKNELIRHNRNFEKKPADKI